MLIKSSGDIDNVSISSFFKYIPDFQDLSAFIPGFSGVYFMMIHSDKWL